MGYKTRKCQSRYSVLTLANAFPAHIDGNTLVGDLKKVIKAEKQNDFAGVDADRLKLWKVEITINEIGDYWTGKPPKKHIHVLVEPPASTATSSREQELLDRISVLEKSLSKSVYGMYFYPPVLRPDLRNFKWTVDIDDATLDGLKEYIREMGKPPALENDGALLLIETPSKPFNEWTFPKVCELYGLSDDPNPSTDVFPLFSCGSANLSSDKSKAVVKHLMAELKLRQDVTPLDRAHEATKTIYSYCYLASAVSFYKDNFKLIPEKPVEGRNGQGNLDYAVECRSTGGILGVI
ncbi:hypothetical protein RhiirB3_449768 [Rhizophagus irregularis]|nr:hypothetical protein RhiirB3_449768 [Rhizophagus irregularis]